MTNNENQPMETDTLQKIERASFDNAWKSVIERFFPKFIEFYFPNIYQQIDWEQEYFFRDNELQSIEFGKGGFRRADKLVSLKALNGKTTNVMLHIEVQDGDKSGFAERMFM